VEGEDEVEDPDEDGMLNAPDESDGETGIGETPQGSSYFFPLSLVSANSDLIAMKWIKGALIGIGSFGKVYLGMDESTGLLMAVKQVEIPTRSAPNQEYKKLKLNALEREIELLKDLQHENIVQYLCAS
jgi:mitogen-activated protein kinase kinase kinase